MENFFPALILVSFCSVIAYSQDRADSFFHLKEFPTEGLVLNSGWTFHAEDNQAYASYNYDGKDGIPINPALLLEQLPVVRRSGIGWFRLRLQVDSSLRNKTIGITLTMLGAAEIYVNEERVYQFGNVSTNYKRGTTQALYRRCFQSYTWQ